MSAHNNTNAAKGKRYSEKEKSEILAFVEKVNSDKGRGGQSAAAKKYKISQLTISSWIKASGGSSGGSAKFSKAAAKGGLGSKLAKLANLAAQIDKAQKDLAKLQAQFSGLKKSL